jgi:hypothetical protein
MHHQNRSIDTRKTIQRTAALGLVAALGAACDQAPLSHERDAVDEAALVHARGSAGSTGRFAP